MDRSTDPSTMIDVRAEEAPEEEERIEAGLLDGRGMGGYRMRGGWRRVEESGGRMGDDMMVQKRVIAGWVWVAWRNRGGDVISDG